MDTLQDIRELADECVKLGAEYLIRKEQATDCRKAWESAQQRLQDLCRSHRTSQEVAERPLIKAVEEAAESTGEALPEGADWVKDTFDSLLGIGYTEQQARVRVNRALSSGEDFASVADAVGWIHGHTWER